MFLGKFETSKQQVETKRTLDSVPCPRSSRAPLVHPFLVDYSKWAAIGLMS